MTTKAFAALRKLGFREGETRRVLSEVCNHPGQPVPSLERVLREAVARLTSSSKAQNDAAKRRVNQLHQVRHPEPNRTQRSQNPPQ